MKKILLSMMLAFALILGSNAQSGQKQLTGKNLSTYISTQLNLDGSTSASLEKILVDSENKLKLINNGKGTDAQKFELVKANLNLTDAQVKKLLTPEKYAEYQTLIKKGKQGNGNGNQPSAEQQAKLEQFKKELGITDDQATELMKIHKELQVTKKQIRAANPNNPEVAKSQIKVANESAKNKAAKILTPEQQAKFVEMIQKEANNDK